MRSRSLRGVGLTGSDFRFERMPCRGGMSLSACDVIGMILQASALLNLVTEITSAPQIGLM